MAVTSEFYLIRAEESAREAENAVLANVRALHERAEAKWRKMAERAQQGEAERSRLAEEKARAADDAGA